MGIENDDAQDGDEPLELTDVVDPDKGSDPDEDDGGDDPDPNVNVNDEDDGETVVAFGDEDPEPEQPDNKTIREMRQAMREKDRRIKELEQSTKPQTVEVGEKPTLAGCEFDEERFEQELDQWKDRKAAADRQAQTQAEQSRKANERWQAKLADFETSKSALPYDDRDDTINDALSGFSELQQQVIVKAASNSGLFLYALGKSPAKIAELSKIDDLVDLAAAVARMEGAVKVTRKAPAPDRPATGTGKMPGGVDKELEKLEREAERTRDRTKLVAYKKKLKEQGK